MPIKGKAGVSTDLYNNSSSEEYLKLLKNGTVSVADFFQVMAIEGRAFRVDGGGYATTSLTAAGAYDADGADIVLDIPSGTAVIPVHLKITVDTMTDDEDIEIAVYWANLANTVSAGTEVTIYNMNTASGIGSACTCNMACDAAGSTDVTAATRIGTIYRSYAELGAAPAAAQSEEGRLDNSWTWDARGDLAPIVTGASGSSITGHIMKGTAAKFFASLSWIELPSDWFS